MTHPRGGGYSTSSGRSATARRWPRGAVAGVAIAALAGCGSAGADPAGDRSEAVSDAGVSHIHGVGINPADDAVILATHSGLFRAAAGQQRAERVGDRRQDTMGFTVVGPDRFLGSGHPDLRDDLPPLLGLIDSDDAGRNWTSRSLLGEADFHVLRAAGRRVYGVNAADGRLLVSDDGGRGWTPRTPPEPFLDLAIDPRNPERIVASGEGGVFGSKDAGRSWRPLNADRAGLLAWTGRRLTLIDGAGGVHASTDAGRTFNGVGRVDGQPAALSARDDQLLVALPDNTVRASSDGGRRWTLRVQGS